MGAKRHVARRLALIQPELRFEPLPGFVHQRDHGDGHLAKIGRQGGDVVVGLFRRCVQDAVFPQGRQTLGFVVGIGASFEHWSGSESAVCPRLGDFRVLYWPPRCVGRISALPPGRRADIPVRSNVRWANGSGTGRSALPLGLAADRNVRAPGVHLRRSRDIRLKGPVANRPAMRLSHGFVRDLAVHHVEAADQRRLQLARLGQPMVGQQLQVAVGAVRTRSSRST